MPKRLRNKQVRNFLLYRRSVSCHSLPQDLHDRSNSEMKFGAASSIRFLGRTLQAKRKPSLCDVRDRAIVSYFIQKDLHEVDYTK